jgi:glycosyltransferase involved in cell wall biosynthesis
MGELPSLAVFPNDPLAAYLSKGEVKPRYFNPADLLDEVHIFTPADSEASVEQVQAMFGTARVTIHHLGHLDLLNYRSKASLAAEKLAAAKCDVVRAYNPLLQGYVAARAARASKLPFVLSVHSNYDHDSRAMALREGHLASYLKLLYTKWFVEPDVIRSADVVICAYRFVEEYVRRRRRDGITTIYNRVYLDEYRVPRESHEGFVVMTVGRLDKARNHSTLVRAAIISRADLLIVGDGPEREALEALSRGAEGRVRLMKSVPHSEMARLYRSADVFALAMKYGGISIPVLEAMAAGLPLVLAKENLDGDKELVEGASLLVDNDVESFAEAFDRLRDPDLRASLSRVSLGRAPTFDASLVEGREAEVYRSLLQSEAH